MSDTAPVGSTLAKPYLPAPDELRARLAQVADGLLALPYEAWNFGDSVAFEGMIAASAVLGDPRWLAFAHGFVRAWSTGARPHRRLDCTAAGFAMVEIHRRTGDPLVLQRALDLARYLQQRPRIGGVFATWEHSPLLHPYGPAQLSAEAVMLVAEPPAGVFIDCLHFDPPFFVALGQVCGDANLITEGISQALGYVRLLQAEDGTFDHFILEGSAQTYGPRWGRGQGWGLLGLLTVLELVGPEHECASELAAAARRCVEAMLSTQRTTGDWDAVVGDPGSGDETSTAAFMATGFLHAGRLGVLPMEQVQAPAHRAFQAALDATDATGLLTGVSAAVMACTEPSHYAHVPRGFQVPWGQGPLAMALSRFLEEAEAP